jgi:dephospho-CoA kinase
VHLFGLTGGIASGKSAVAARLRERRMPVIDADILARGAVAKGSDGLAAVVARFGEGILDESGGLDRKKLAAMVFSDDAARRALNAIVHPRVTALTMKSAAELAARGEPLACYEAALLVENGVADAFRPLIVVSAPEDIQVARAMARDGATEAEARARVRSQMPLEEKIRVADHVIENTGSREELQWRTDEVLERIARSLRVDAARYK